MALVRRRRPNVDTFPYSDRKCRPLNHAANWSSSHVGGGAIAAPFRTHVNTSIAVNSRGLFYATLFDMNSGNLSIGIIDWDKRLEIHVDLARVGDDVQCIGRLQLKSVNTQGVLAALGLGLEINNFAVNGEGYGTALGTVALAALTSNRVMRFKIVLTPGVSIAFYQNGVLMGTLTGTAVPVGNSGGQDYCVVSIINGAAGAVDCNLIIDNFWVVQWIV